MDKTQALSKKNKIIALCKEDGVWYKDLYDHAPELKMITISITIKVDKE